MEVGKVLVVATVTIVLGVLANPVPLESKSNLQTILQLMATDVNICKFPPPDVLLHPTKAPYILPCQKPIPVNEDLVKGITGLRSYADETDDNYLFLCMGFYDLSLQICKSPLVSVNSNSLINDTTQFNNKFNDQTRGSTFCSNFQPYASSKSNYEVTKDWVTVLNENLADPDTCKRWCTRTKRNKVSVHPICKIILWGRQLLQPVDETVPEDGMDSDTLDSGAQQDQYQDMTTDLEAPDVSPQQPIMSDPTSLQTPLNAGVGMRQPINGGSVAPVQQLPTRPDLSVQPIRGSEAAPEPHDPRAEGTAVHTGIEDTGTPISKKENLTDDGSKISPVPLPENNLTKEIPLVEKNNSKISSTSPTAVVVITPKSDKPVESAVQPDDKLYPSSPSSSSSSSSSSPSSVATPSSNPMLTDGLGTISDPNEDPGNNEQPPDEYGNVLDQESSKQENRDDAQFGGDGGEDDEPMMHMPKENSRPSSNFGRASFTETEDSHFFAYFLTMVVICIIAYVVFHNKQKIMALAVEGRRGGRSQSRRRPSTSSYRKLDSNLEEAISSATPRSTNAHVIY